MVRIVIGVVLLLSFSLWGENLVINEISLGDNHWIEIYNPTSQVIDLSGWKIANRNGVDELSGVVYPRSYYVVAEAPDFSGGLPGHLYLVPDGEIGNGLSSSADMIALINPNGTVIDQVNWGTPSPSWPSYGVPLWNPGISVSPGAYLARIPNGVDRDLPQDFKNVFIPTPGQPNPLTTGLDTSSWGKIKALFSGQRRG
jgi:hypothetical protein